MTIAERFGAELVLALGVALLFCESEAIDIAKVDTNEAGYTIFDVNSYGAKADGSTNNQEAFMKAWVAACKSSSLAKLVFPKGTYLTGPVIFNGPCKGPGPIIFAVQGTLKATIALSDYSSPEWLLFQNINGLRINGGGTFYGQGEAVWKFNDCRKNPKCQLLPTSISLKNVKDAIISEVTSLNSKSFHSSIHNSENINVHDFTATAPGDSPNTDGIHISRSNLVSISNSVIGTGDDCISIGDGSTQLTITSVTCGPGHGISVGSLGKYDNEQDVKGIIVSHCTLKGTTNGARIKTWEGSGPSKASAITFEDLIMDSVKNPIIIDQKYSSRGSSPSRVQLSDIHFKNIRGTTISPVAVSLACSSLVPCQVELEDIDLKPASQGKGPGSLTSSCSNAKVKCGGKENPPCCQ